MAGARQRRVNVEELASTWSTWFTEHRGQRVHVVTYASINRFVLHLALSLQRAGGFLNVLGTRSDRAALPRQYRLDLSTREEHNFTFAYRAVETPELDYRRILFKRLYHVWSLAKRLPDRDLLIYVDGHDVLFQRPLDELVGNWLRMDTGQVVFMGYPWCRNRFKGRQMGVAYPLPDGGEFLGAFACGLWRKRQRKGTLRFLDTGAYMGRAAAVREVLADAASLARAGIDYICMTAVHAVGAARPGRLRVDTEAELFYTILPRRPGDSLANWSVELARPLCEPGYFDAVGLPPRHSVTGRTPAVLHFVGTAKWYHLNRCVRAFAERVGPELAAVATCRYISAAGGVECVEGLGQQVGYRDVDLGVESFFPMQDVLRL